MKEVKIVINLVDQLSSVNFGIWHAAIATSPSLSEKFGVRSILVVPKTGFEFDRKAFPHTEPVFLDKTDAASAAQFFAGFSKEHTIVVSHGAWRFPTKWGNQAKKMGFVWVYTPHGMLEPWSMSQKKWKKTIYFHCIEKRLALNADGVRAVGLPEAENLRKHFPMVRCIPNGIYPSDILDLEKPQIPLTFLFLGRLHHKKGIMQLLAAWEESAFLNNPDCRLIVAGTPDGEEGKVAAWKAANPESNVEITGPVFGEKKRNILSLSQFYVLPSLSEGFPVSVVEAMAAGLIPLITKGCNFPEVFTENLGIEISPNVPDIADGLLQAWVISEMMPEKFKAMSERNRRFVQEHFNWETIADQQFEWYLSLLNREGLSSDRGQ